MSFEKNLFFFFKKKMRFEKKIIGLKIRPQT